MSLVDQPLVKNYLWPAIMACASAAVTAVMTNAPAILGDGIQQGDLMKLGGIALSAAIGYVATIMQRHAGKAEPWMQPAK